MLFLLVLPLALLVCVLTHLQRTHDLSSKMHACDKFKPFFPPKPPAAEAKVGWRAIFGEQSLDVNDTCLLNIVCEDSGFLEVQFFAPSAATVRISSFVGTFVLRKEAP